MLFQDGVFATNHWAVYWYCHNSINTVF